MAGRLGLAMAVTCCVLALCAATCDAARKTRGRRAMGIELVHAAGFGFWIAPAALQARLEGLLLAQTALSAAAICALGLAGCQSNDASL